MTGRINSIQSLGTVDGPGVRAVVFGQGCPLRCSYCHNPDTWIINDGQIMDEEELYLKIHRLYPYIKNGGVTFSGGEPCLQAEFFAEIAKRLHADGIHIALDTSGCVIKDNVTELLRYTDLVLLDIKFTSEDDYKRYTGGSLERTLDFLSIAEKMGISVWVRHVVIPGINDTKEDVIRLRDIISGFKCVKKLELLPFRKLCVPKYNSLGIPFPHKDTPPCDKEIIDYLYGFIEEYR